MPKCRSAARRSCATSRTPCATTAQPGVPGAGRDWAISSAAARWTSKAPVKVLVQAASVKTRGDFFRLSVENIKIARQYRKSAENLYASIQRARVRPLFRIIHGMRSPQVGVTTAIELANWLAARSQPRDDEPMGGADGWFKRIATELRHVPASDFEQIEGVGPTIAAALEHWLTDPQPACSITRVDAGVEPERPARATGAAHRQDGRRNRDADRLRSRAGRQRPSAVPARTSGSSVSKKTDYLVAHSAGSKLAKAQELGVAVLDEAGFRRFSRAKRGVGVERHALADLLARRVASGRPYLEFPALRRNVGWPVRPAGRRR